MFSLTELVFLFGLWVAPAVGLSAAELTQNRAANAGMHAFNVAGVSVGVLGRIVYAAALATPVALLALVLVVVWILATSIAFIRRTAP